MSIYFECQVVARDLQDYDFALSGGKSESTLPLMRKK
jgi:hypothetical protein